MLSFISLSVSHLSFAEIPVEILSLASTLTVKFVSCKDVFELTIGSNFSSSLRSGVIATHINPLPYFIIKLISSEVALSAGIIKSPSFSRCSSSITITIFPAFISSRARSMFFNFSIAFIYLLVPEKFSINLPTISVSILTLCWVL